MKSRLAIFPPAGTVTAEPTEETARMALQFADEIAVAEARLKELILEAHDRGDFAGAAEIVRRWQSETPIGLVRSLEGKG